MQFNWNNSFTSNFWQSVREWLNWLESYQLTIETSCETKYLQLLPGNYTTKIKLSISFMVATQLRLKCSTVMWIHCFYWGKVRFPVVYGPVYTIADRMSSYLVEGDFYWIGQPFTLYLIAIVTSSIRPSVGMTWEQPAIVSLSFVFFAICFECACQIF